MSPLTEPNDIGAGSRQRERQLQEVEELCAAAIRAISGQPDLHYRASRLHRGNLRLPSYAPHLHPTIDEDDFSSFRGAADGIALRLAHSDPLIHQQNAPSDPTARIIYELLEQLRVESLPGPELTGLRHNLQHRFEQWSLRFHHSGLTETLSGLILYSTAQMCRARINGDRVLEATEDLIETTRGKLISIIGNDLRGLRPHRLEQSQFAPHARALGETIAALLSDLADQTGSDPDSPEEQRLRPTGFSLWMDFDGEQTDSTPVATTERSGVLESAGGAYRVFTRAYDATHHTASLVRASELQAYRAQLDDLISRQQLNYRRLARRLKTLLAEPVNDGWDRAREEGRIDGSRLSQLICSPAERRLFMSDRVEPVADAVLTILLDCSGSMKTNAEPLAVMVDVMSRALDQAGISNEILGFTTGAWNGGRAQRDWRKMGRPRHPGRLNESWHLIFKDANLPWRRSRAAIAALLKSDLFREGVDGEAVEWACSRLLDRPEPRKLLLVVSDGCPMDSATQQSNDPTYLDQHLLQVVQKHEAAGQIQIAGIGVGLDLSAFYSRCQAIDLGQGMNHAVFDEILALISGTRRR